VNDPAFIFAVKDVMYERVNAGFLYIWILMQIITGAEFWGRVFA